MSELQISKDAKKHYALITYEALKKIEKEERAARKAAAFRPIVYVCSPYSGNIERNIANAKMYSRFAVLKNTIPFAPHLLLPQYISEKQERSLEVTVGKVSESVMTIESDLPNVLKKNVIIGKSNADINKLILYDAADYGNSVTYFLHSDLSYDRKNSDRITPVLCDMRSIQTEEGGSFNNLAIQEAAEVFGRLTLSAGKSSDGAEPSA